VNKQYGTRILASGATAQRTGAAIVWREIDRVRVKGRAQPVVMFEPVAEASGIAADVAERTQVYERALMAYRARKFDAAAAAFATLADSDEPARLFMTRARAFAAAAPPEEWDGVVTLDVK
jgi:adenylate cyclase